MELFVVPLAHAQKAIGAPGKVEEIIVSNRGGASDGVAHTDAVVRALGAIIHHGKGVDEAMQIGALRN